MFNVPRNHQTIVSLLSGAEPAAVERCGTLERFGTWVQAATLLITGLFAFVGATYAMHDALSSRNPVSAALWLSALSVGVVWGTLIFCLDFMCVRSLDGDMSGRRKALVVLPRLLLAGVSAFLISVPIKAWLFQDEIAIFMLDQKQQKKVAAGASSAGQLAASQGPLDSAAASAARFSERLKGSPDVPEYREAVERIAQLEPRVDQLKARRATLRREADALARQADALEPESSGYAAAQAKAESARASARRCADELSATENQLRTARDNARTVENAWRAELNESLRAAEAERAAASATHRTILTNTELERGKTVKELDETYDKTGFTSKVVALARLGASSEIHRYLILGVFFLFYLVDAAPTLAKTLSSRDEYLAALAAVRQERLDYINQASNARVVLHERVIEIKRVAAENALAGLERRLATAGSTLDVREARDIGQAARLALEDLS